MIILCIILGIITTIFTVLQLIVCGSMMIGIAYGFIKDILGL
jgi:ABC-type lipoprotein release transport system permease subunit